MSNRPTPPAALRGLLVIGGAGPASPILAAMARDAQTVVAADSGLDLCLTAGIVPDFVVGDMDSLSDVRLLEKYPPENVLRFPTDKDETDTEIGLRIMREQGCTRVEIAGGGGGRLDHLLALVGLFEREQPPAFWRTDEEEIHLVEGERVFDGWMGATVSVFPIGESVGDMHSEGLQWPLDHLVFRRGYPGISNRAIADRVRIGAHGGRILVIKSNMKDS